MEPRGGGVGTHLVAEGRGQDVIDHLLVEDGREAPEMGGGTIQAQSRGSPPGPSARFPGASQKDTVAAWWSTMVTWRAGEREWEGAGARLSPAHRAAPFRHSPHTYMHGPPGASAPAWGCSWVLLPSQRQKQRPEA